MIGLDTNVLVRYLAQDDPAQSAAATQLLDGFIAQTGKRAGCDETATFDRRAAKGAKMRLLAAIG